MFKNTNIKILILLLMLLLMFNSVNIISLILLVFANWGMYHIDIVCFDQDTLSIHVCII